MTPLRAKYIRDLVIHGRSKNTQEAYTRYVCDLARYYRRSPELISYGEVTGWLYYLITERQLSASSVNIAVSAVRFLYAVTLGRETLNLMASVSDMKRAIRARGQRVEAILTPPRQPRGRPVTPLRAKYIRDLVIRGRSKHTQEAYIRYVRDLARYYRRSPELISYEEVTGWLYHLIKERQLSASSVNIAVSAVRFLYAVTLGRETLDLMASVSDMKRATGRADSEVEAILTPPRQPRSRPVTPLRAKYIRDLVIRGRSKHTQEAYIRYVRDLARSYRRSPELISYEQVTGWLYHLIKERQLSASSVNIAVSAVRFLYAVTLGRETLDLMASVSDMKRATGRADSEVEAILTPPRQPRGRPVTPLRAKYIRDLARYYRRSPELISYEEVTGWLYHLIKERQLSASSVNIAVSAVRFLYAVTLGRETLDLMASVPHMKRATRLAEVYARCEVEAILTAPRQPRDRVLLMTVYGCGLRISEATQLKTSDIDRARMQLRVRDGKGAKGRVLPLSERLLKELVNYWRAQRQGKAGHDSPWLFLGKKAGQPMSTYAGQNIYYSALKKSGVRYKGGIHTLRHSFATHLMESGVELPLVQHLLGHSSLRTTALYLHVTARRLAEVHSPLDLIGSGGIGQ